MIDPMAAGTVKRPPTDLRHPRGREALATHPPAPVDDTTGGSREQSAENTAAPATLLPPENTDSRKTATLAWSKAETERRRRDAATPPTLAPIDAFPDDYSTADQLAAIRPTPTLTPPVRAPRSFADCSAAPAPAGASAPPASSSTTPCAPTTPPDANGP